MTNSPGYDQYLKGLELLESNQYKKAISQLQLSLKKNPTQPGTLHNLGFANQQLGNHQQAIDFYQKTLSLLPNLQDTHHNLANTYLGISSSENALKHYQKVLDINPHHPQAQLGKSICLLKTDHPQKASQIQSFRNRLLFTCYPLRKKP